MKIIPKNPKQYICIFTIPTSTFKEGAHFIFFAMDAYSEYVMAFEVMPNNSQKEYQNFIKTLSNKENINGSIIILNLETLNKKEKAELLKINTKIKDIIADPISCDILTKTVRESWEKKFS
jgi:hypothetical protein